jgi:HAE1 family hydrophobic/amphiphilic exporter-1
VILTRISVDNPVFATMMMVALAVLGLFAYRGLSIDQFPQVDFPVVVVTTDYPGASPEIVETEISRKIEEAVNTIAGIRTLTSRSYEGKSVVVAEFELTVASAIAAQDVREKVQQVRAGFRDEVEEPQILRFNPDDQPILSVAVRSDIRSLRDLTTITDQVILKRLENVRGVGRATIVGGVKRQINIYLKPERLNALGIGVNEVIRALKEENRDVPAGNVTRGADDRVIEVKGRLAEPGEFLDLIVARRGGAPVLLRQIADVVDGAEEKESAALLNGQPALAIDVVKAQDANTIDVAKGLVAAVEELQQRGDIPSDIRLDIVRDTSRGIRNSVDNVQRTLVEGGILTILIVFIFLQSWRSTVITGLALPISVLGAFLVIAAAGFTLNVMTLLALSLAIGILIDDAIVVRENITRHIAMGKSHRQAALDGTNEIGLAVLATTFTIVAVFLPVAFMGGIIGRFFLQFGLVVSAAVLLSLFVSFTLDPMLSSVWYDPAAHGARGRFGRAFGAGFDRLVAGYRRLIAWALDHRKTTLLLAAVAFFGSFGVARIVGTEFVPAADLGEQVVTIETPVGSSLEYTTEKLAQVDAAIREFPEIAYAYGTVNTGVVQGKNQASLYLRYKELSERKRSPDDLAPDIRKRLESIPGIKYSIGIPGIGGVQKQLQVSVQGRDVVELDRIAGELVKVLENIPGAVDIDTNLKAAKPTLAVQLDRQVASDLGVTPGVVAESLRPLFAGEEVGTWKAPDGENYTVMARLAPDDRLSRLDLERIWLSTGKQDADGAPRMVALKDLAKVEVTVGPSQINRRDLQREVQVTANVSGAPLGQVSQALSDFVQKMELPPGYRIVFGGQTKDMAESAAYAGQALLLAVILIYLILASQFGSFLQPFAIMASLPLSIIGVFVGLLVAGSTLNIFSIIGFIMLMGLVTKNAILLVDFANQARARGLAIREALIEAGAIRLRPIIMTTLAMVFGMLPLALGIGEGAKQRAPMAHAVIGGLISSTLLTLVVVPVILVYIDRLANFAKRHLARNADAEASADLKHPAE